MAKPGEDLEKYQNTYKALFEKNTPAEEIKKIYDDWAESYDEVVSTNWNLDVENFHVRSIMTEYYGSNKDVKILDVGAGTGRLAKLLKEPGFTNIDALDASSQMLEVAKKDNLYKSYICEFLGPKKLDIEDGHYDVLFGLGSLLPSHVNEDAFEEMIRLTKPGGYIIHMVRDGAIESGRIQIEEHMQKLHDEGKWEWKVKEFIPSVRVSDIGTTTDVYKYVFQIPLNKQ